jgi:hypothetical protein
MEGTIKKNHTRKPLKNKQIKVKKVRLGWKTCTKNKKKYFWKIFLLNQSPLPLPHTMKAI